ncbi:GNAT family N-acetyltransferase [Sphingomonas profundi]|uniref:GNAT family N-acetyltransferase n=1 Tax=Alterirhizorhabdus profundi TaxID=2681549 RepID=UPI0012E94C1F|nr:GNAT family N-acetyltransferase [Sphingomonas profundi]
MARPHPLDRPVWQALTTRQAPLAIGNAAALRLSPDYGPFAAAADGSAESLAALAALLPAEGGLWLLEAGEMPAPPGTAITARAACHQMIAERVAPHVPATAFEPLGENDAAEMRALAALTRPGPFAGHTHRFGGFIGVRVAGRLVAMAGERMKPDGYAEVSGVCTHPDHRGRGHAAALMRAVMAGIAARGETPFLHVYASNGGAVALYETLGFAIRATLTKTVLVRA